MDAETPEEVRDRCTLESREKRKQKRSERVLPVSRQKDVLTSERATPILGCSKRFYFET